MSDSGDPRDDDWMFDPSLAAMNRRLQQEIREEAQEVESIVEESELRERMMNDVAREARNRGDFVAVSTAMRAFNGQIVYSGRDFVTVKTESFEVDVNLAAIAYLRVLEKGRRGGAAIGDGPGTFEMRLVERKSPALRVEIGYRMLEQTVIGHIKVVGQDHVIVVDDQKAEWAIPLPAIAYVMRRDRGPAR